MIKLILKQMLSVIICIAVLLSLFPGTVVIAAMPEDYKLWLFNNESSLSIIETNNTSVSFDSERSAMKVSSTGTDPFVRLDYSAAALSTRAHTYVILVYEVEASNTNTSKTQVFFSTSNKVYESPDACHSFYAQKGDLCYEIIDLSAASYWTGNVHKLRLDIFQSFDRSDCMYVYAVGLAQTAGEAEAMVKRFVTPTTTSERMVSRSSCGICP